MHAYDAGKPRHDVNRNLMVTGPQLLAECLDDTMNANFIWCVSMTIYRSWLHASRSGSAFNMPAATPALSEFGVHGGRFG